MNLEQGLRRLVVVLSVVVMAVGVAADALLGPEPPWKVSLALRDGRKAILRLTWGSNFAHNRKAVAAKLTGLLRCAAGEPRGELDCLAFDQEAVMLPHSSPADIAKQAEGGQPKGLAKMAKDFPEPAAAPKSAPAKPRALFEDVAPPRMARAGVRMPDGRVVVVEYPAGATDAEIKALASLADPLDGLGSSRAPLPSRQGSRAETLAAIREAFPLYREVPDDVLARDLARRYPMYGYLLIPDITEGDVTNMRVVREWSWPAVEFTTTALGVVVLLWLGFFALRWVARGFVSHV